MSRLKHHEVIFATMFFGIAGVAVFGQNERFATLPPEYVRASQAFDGHDWEVFLETPAMNHATNNETDDREVNANGWLAVWQANYLV